MSIERLIEAWEELLIEAYYDRDSDEALPSVGKKRSMAGLKIRNAEAHRWLHIFEDRMERMASEMEKRFRELGEKD